MATKYNPYNAVKNISELKGKYHTAKDLGSDANQYHTSAVPYYTELIENGYGDLADELTASDYTKSLDILNRYKPDSKFNIDSIYSDLIGDASSIGSGKTSPVMSEGVSKILDSFNRTDDNLNGEIRYDSSGNVVGGLNLDHYNTGKNQLDYLNNFDYTAQPYYDSIMQTYQLKGSDAAKGELAGGASSNAGNIDSYAAANANRQQLAFTNEGHQAALAAAQQNQANWQALYDAMSGNLSDMGQINAQNLATGANMYAVDSAERQNALNTAAGLATDEATRKLNQYLAELENETTRYGVDTEKEMNAANNASALEQLIKQIEAEMQMNAADNAIKKYGYDSEQSIAAANNQASLEQLIKQIEAEKEIAGMNNRNEIDKLLLQLQGSSDSNGTNNTEASGVQSLYRDLNGMINMMNNNEDESLKTYNDVYMAALELYPEYANEIKAYINNIISNSGRIPTNLTGDLIGG